MQKLLLSILTIGFPFLLIGKPIFLTPAPLKFANSNTYKSYDWDSIPNQTWLGYSFWCNSYLDWKVEDHRLVGYPYYKNQRTAHISSYSIDSLTNWLDVKAKIGFFDEKLQGVAGFLIGAGDQSLNHNSILMMHNNTPNTFGLKYLVSTKGELLLLEHSSDSIIYRTQLGDSLKPYLFSPNGVDLSISFKTENNQLTTYLKVKGTSTIQFSDTIYLPKSYLSSGTIAITYDSQRAFSKFMWMDNLKLHSNHLNYSGKKQTNLILSSFYTTQDDSLFITFQLQPFSIQSSDQFVFSITDRKEEITEYSNYQYDTLTYQIRYRISIKDIGKNCTYGLRYRGKQVLHSDFYNGKIKQARKRKNKLKIMALNCNGFPFMHEGPFDYTHLWYPYEQIQKGFNLHQPELLVFLGDQFYESRPSMPITKEPFCYLDYLYKWNLYCLQFRDLTANTPTIILTDDHDVFQGNLWGKGGIPAKDSSTTRLQSYYENNYDTWQQDNGGYFMPSQFLKMAITSQTSHLPHPYKKDTLLPLNYYTSLTYGKFDFALMEDKKFKSAPSEINHPVFNGKPLSDSLTIEQLDSSAFQLLGNDQLQFLNEFLSRKNKTLKIILTQSAYAALTTIDSSSHPLHDLPANIHGHHKLNRDMDANGWPRNGRNKAMNVIGNHPVLVLAGDQHMGSVVQLYDSANNATTFFTVPAIANTWPRTWMPMDTTSSNYPLGEYTDGFGNKMNVIAVANPIVQEYVPNDINSKSPGFGIIELNYFWKTAKLHAYPLYFDQLEEKQEYHYWPIKIKVN